MIAGDTEESDHTKSMKYEVNQTRPPFYIHVVELTCIVAPKLHVKIKMQNYKPGLSATKRVH